MNLEEALYYGITGQTRLGSEGTDVVRMTREIERAIGGKYSDVARALGVPRTTWRNWRGGARPKPAAFELLRRAQRRARLSGKREAFLRGRPAVRLWADVAISRDTRTRVLRISTWVSWHAMGRFGPILDAWLQLDDTRAAELLLAVIEREIGSTTALDNPYLRTFRTEAQADYWAGSR